MIWFFGVLLLAKDWFALRSTRRFRSCCLSLGFRNPSFRPVAKLLFLLLRSLPTSDCPGGRGVKMQI